MEQPQLKYGDVIRLFTTSSLVADAQGGFVGVVKMGKKNIKYLSVIPPIPEGMSGSFMESDFTIEPPDETKMGMPITYGDPIILADNTDCTWNNKIEGNKGCLGFRERGAKGEVHVTFVKQGFYSMPVRKEDSGLALNIIESNRKRRTFNKTVSHARKSGTKNFGGFMCCDGSGQALKFTVHKVPKIVKRKKKVLKKRKKSVKSDDETKENNIADDGASTAEEGEVTADEGEKTADEGEKTADEGENTADEAEKTADEAEKTADDEKKNTGEGVNAVDKGQKSDGDAAKTASNREQKGDEKKKKADEGEKPTDTRQTDSNQKGNSENNDEKDKEALILEKNEPEKQNEDKMQTNQELDKKHKDETKEGQEQLGVAETSNRDNGKHHEAEANTQKREEDNSGVVELEKKNNEALKRETEVQRSAERKDDVGVERKEGINLKGNQEKHSHELVNPTEGLLNNDERGSTKQQKQSEVVGGMVSQCIEKESIVERQSTVSGKETKEIKETRQAQNVENLETLNKDKQMISEDKAQVAKEKGVSDIKQDENQGESDERKWCKEEQVPPTAAISSVKHEETRNAQHEVQENVDIVSQHCDMTTTKSLKNSDTVMKKKSSGSSPERKRYPSVDDMDGNVHDVAHGCPTPSCCLIA